MTIHAIPQIMPFTFVPKQDRDSDIKTTFTLKPLNGLQHMEVLREIDDKGFFTSRGLKLALQYGLAGWENFNDEHGTPVPFSTVNFAAVPPFILHEIGVEIINRSSLGETERKNS